MSAPATQPGRRLDPVHPVGPCRPPTELLHVQPNSFAFPPLRLPLLRVPTVQVRKLKIREGGDFPEATQQAGSRVRGQESRPAIPPRLLSTLTVSSFSTFLLTASTFLPSLPAPSHSLQPSFLVDHSGRGPGGRAGGMGRGPEDMARGHKVPRRGGPCGHSGARTATLMTHKVGALLPTPNLLKVQRSIPTGWESDPLSFAEKSHPTRGQALAQSSPCHE